MQKTDAGSCICPYIRQFFRGSLGYFALAIVQTIVLTAGAMLVSWLIQQMIDMISGADIGYTFYEIILLTAAGILLYALGYGFAYLSKPKFIAKAMARYKNYVYEELTKKNSLAFAGENASLYVSALSNDAAAVETNFVCNIFIIIDSVFLCVGALVLMFRYSPLLTCCSVVLSALPLIAAVSTVGMVTEAEKTVSEKNRSYMAALQDSLTGFSVIKSFRAEERMCWLFAEKVRECAEAQCRRRKMAILVQAVSVSAGNILQLGIFLIGTYLALSGNGVSAGSVLIFIQLLNYVINPIETIPQAISEMRSALALIEKLARALSENIREKGKKQIRTLEKGIRLEDLSFSYEADKPVLRGVSYTLEAGKSYCIVGASGSGKSTLLNLLSASHDTYTGRILYDGTDLREIDSDSLFDLLSVIRQNVFVFNATIRDNITMFGRYKDAEVKRAIRLAGLAEFTAQRGVDTLCGENGSGLSGGEKQRISIARSLLRRPGVLLMDEATASLDAKTAYQVTDTVLGMEGITRIVVTHTLDAALLKRYDGILALKNGVIAESGTFAELLEKKGYFYSLYMVAK